MSRAPAGRQPRFSRQRVAEVAFKIADRDGFESLSMRRVAQELGSGTMTLYHYVRTKDELVALMDDQAMGLLLVPEEVLALPWREAFSAILRRTYRMRVEHPWSLFALQNATLGRNALRHHEQTLAALEGSPFDAAQKQVVMAVADSFVDGHALRGAELASRTEPEGTLSEPARRLWEELQEGPYPRTRTSLDAGRRAALGDARVFMEEALEQGLAALLDGLTSRFGGQS